MFNFLKNKLTSIYNQFTEKAKSLFGQNKVDENTLKELEKLLINADAGVKTTRNIIQNLKSKVSSGQISQGKDLKEALAQELTNILKGKSYNPEADVYLLVGINGSGKTTFTSKLGYWLKNNNNKVLFVAADTFRAAAVEQIENWGQRLNIPVVKGLETQDPAAVVYKGCQEFKDNNYDKLVIDTAGRLQTKVNLMKELEKIKRTIQKQLPDKKISTLLTIDSMLGQNSFDQAKIFNESTQVDGIILTKLDGTGKGGIVFSITQELNIPIGFISYGEQPDQMSIFNPEEYINNLLEK